MRLLLTLCTLRLVLEKFSPNYNTILCIEREGMKSSVQMCVYNIILQSQLDNIILETVVASYL